MVGDFHSLTVSEMLFRCYYTDNLMQRQETFFRFQKKLKIYSVKRKEKLFNIASHRFL